MRCVLSVTFQKAPTCLQNCLQLVLELTEGDRHGLLSMGCYLLNQSTLKWRTLFGCKQKGIRGKIWQLEKGSFNTQGETNIDRAQHEISLQWDKEWNKLVAGTAICEISLLFVYKLFMVCNSLPMKNVVKGFRAHTPAFIHAQFVHSSMQVWTHCALIHKRSSCIAVEMPLLMWVFN